MNQKIELVKKELLKYGIHNEEELKKAIKNMQPLNIGCMVSPIGAKKKLVAKEKNIQDQTWNEY